MEKVLVVNDGSIDAGLLSLINSKFEVQEVRDANQALDTLRTNQLQGRGFGLVISYAHKCQRDATALKTFIKREFQQQLPIVCFKCISEAGECFDELKGMLARVLIDKWKSNTEQKACQKKWTREHNFNFFSVVEHLESTNQDVKPTTVLNAMSANERGLDLTVKHVNSHLQKYRNFKTNRVVSSETSDKRERVVSSETSDKRERKPRKNKLARHFEEYETIETSNSPAQGSLYMTSEHKFLQEISNGFPMDISYNGSVPPEAWPEYSPFASQQPYVQAMPSISPAPSQQINNNSQFHDIVGTSQQSLNQDSSFPPSQFDDVDWASIFDD